MAAELTVSELLSRFAIAAFSGGIAIAYAWLLRLEFRGQRQQGQLAELRLHVAENYASSVAVEKLSDKLDKALAILNKLEGRQEATGG